MTPKRRCDCDHSNCADCVADGYDSEIASLTAALDAERARAEKAERERDEARQMHAECAVTHGSTYGMDWRQWQLASESLKSAEARASKLREALALAKARLLTDVADHPISDRDLLAKIDALLAEEPGT